MKASQGSVNSYFKIISLTCPVKPPIRSLENRPTQARDPISLNTKTISGLRRGLDFHRCFLIAEITRESLHTHIEHWRHIERQELRKHQATYYGYT